MTTAAHRHQLDTFVEGRRGWRIALDNETRDHYAWRTVNVMDVAFHLFLHTVQNRALSRECWVSSYWSQARVHGDSYSGTHDAVLAEIVRVERCLDAMNALRDCRTRLAANEVVEPLKGLEIRIICDVLGISRAGQAGDLRNEIVQVLCGFRLNGARATNGVS